MIIIDAMNPYAFWLMTVGIALLLLATLIKNFYRFECLGPGVEDRSGLLRGPH